MRIACLTLILTLAATAAQAQSLQPGQIMHVKPAEGFDNTAMAPDYFVMTEFVEAILAGDTVGIKELMEAGKLLRVQGETRVRVLKSRTIGGVFCVEVRVEEGTYKDKRLWTGEANLK